MAKQQKPDSDRELWKQTAAELGLGVDEQMINTALVQDDPLAYLQQLAKAKVSMDDDGEVAPEAGKARAEQLPSEPKIRQGSEHRPLCPQCSTEDKPVLCTATNSRSLFTWYGCPNADCNFTVKVPRPRVANMFRRQKAREQAAEGVKRP